MKKRYGHVSNSSSSSFLIKYKEPFSSENNSVLLNKKTCKKLEEYGFIKSYACYPEQIDEDNKNIVTEGFHSYTYSVSCNEMDTLEWLLDNNIPFVTNCHYDQYTLVYEKDSKEILILKNMGMFYLMTNPYYIKDITKEVAAKRLSLEEFRQKGYNI